MLTEKRVGILCIQKLSLTRKIALGVVVPMCLALSKGGL